MCGIAGVIARQPAAYSFGRIPDVARMLVHRGPDDAGYLTFADGCISITREWAEPERPPQAVFVHTRLSIIDLSENGRQPMRSANSRYAIAFNGEIYNYVELREELERYGHVFRSSGDTEVLLAAYAQWGNAAFARLVGMFAFALLDAQARTVVLCRDYFGIKPLFYAVHGDVLSFASELPPLMELVPSRRNVEASQVYRYLRYGITDEGSATLLEGVSQLPAAHYAEIALDSPAEVVPRAYWRLAAQTPSDLSFGEAVARTRELFLESVQLHLRSDVPVGCALSGGVDSSSILCAMRYLAPHQELHAFSYIASDDALSEERWIDLVTSYAGAVVHKVSPLPAELPRELQMLGVAQGEPFGSTSIYAQYCVFREAASAHIKVLLDGQGADELYGGYRAYLGVRLAELVRSGQVARAFAFLRSCAAQPGVSASYVIQKAAEYLLPHEVQGPLRALVGKELVPAWMNGAWFARFGVDGAPPSPRRRASLAEELSRELCATSLPALLRYEDRNSMAWSVESRVPFLTPKLVEFTLSLPASYLIGDDGTSKRVFRAAMRGIVPDAILDRRDKIGFATPESAWMCELNDWVRTMLSSDVARGIPALDVPRVKGLWEETLAGRRAGFDLWRALNLIAWSEQFRVRYA